MIRYIVILDFTGADTFIYPITQKIFDNIDNLEDYINDTLNIDTSNCQYMISNTIEFNVT